MNIAYIGHGYHEKTKSSRFMLDFLQQHSHNLDLFADYSMIGGPGIDLEPIVDGNYDLIVVWQMERVAEWLAARVPEKLVFVPMYDGAKDLKRDFWGAFRHSRVLNFSHSLHELLQSCGIPSLKVQYFPDPSAFPRVDFSEFRGFFWQRRSEISWPLIKQLSAGTKFARFTLHMALDPGFADPHIPDSADVEAFNVELSYWSDDRAIIDELLAHANIYFAPRPSEGIGMSFLEAMARGQCVVAADAPTMSEYMTHGVSGLLYDEQLLRSLDFSKAGEIGAAARRKVERGFAQWQADQRDLLPAYLFGGRDEADALLTRHSFRIASPQPSLDFDTSELAECSEGGRRLKGYKAVDRTDEPLITVAMVTCNASEEFGPTLDSILSQTYPNVEVLVVDGASQDGTRDLIEERADAIDYWVSESDAGPYDGMNKAALLARGRYILFMNAGDLFASKHALAEAMEGISDSNTPDFIIGHHIYVTNDGVEEFHKANDFADTWRMMQEGAYSGKWSRGVPCHQATLTRTTLLCENAYDLSWRVAADHEFMYRMCAKGARFHHSDATLAIYFGGGFSSRNESLCHDEWSRLASIYGDQIKFDLWLRGGSEESNREPTFLRKAASGVLATLRTFVQGTQKGMN